jgi:hypothetical protein
MLADEIKNAKKRGVKLIAFSFTPLSFSTDCLYSYELNEADIEKFWDHKIILVVDQKELLMGEADNTFSKKSAWTYNTAIVDIATNHIILDITLFGLRQNVDVSNTVVSMQKGDSHKLQDLLTHSTPVLLEKLNR